MLERDSAECVDCIAARQSPTWSTRPILRKAAGSAGLKGSRFVGSRGVPGLSVCRECGALWWSWVDQREGWPHWRCLGTAATRIFDAETSLARIVDWVADDYDERMFRPVHELTRMVVRRRPEGLQPGATALFSVLDRLSAPDSDLQAERLTMLFRILALVVARAVRGDLRQPGPRARPPLRWTEGEIDAEVARFVPREEEGLALLALTHDVVRRLLWERRWESGARSRRNAVIAIDDASPLVRVLDSLPYSDVPDGTRRGVFAKAAHDAVSELVRQGLAPENDHAVWMRAADWSVLRQRIDPVVRLAGVVRRLLSTRDDSRGAEARIAMESVLVREPIRLGARFTDEARVRLERCLPALDEPGRRLLQEILELERKALAADANCEVVSRLPD